MPKHAGRKRKGSSSEGSGRRSPSSSAAAKRDRSEGRKRSRSRSRSRRSRSRSRGGHRDRSRRSRSSRGRRSRRRSSRSSRREASRRGSRKRGRKRSSSSSSGGKRSGGGGRDRSREATKGKRGKKEERRKSSDRRKASRSPPGSTKGPTTASKGSTSPRQEKKKKKAASELEKVFEKEVKGKDKAAAKPRAASSTKASSAAEASAAAGAVSNGKVVGDASPKASPPSESSPKAGIASSSSAAGGKRAPIAALGDLAELQRGLEKERGMLQLFVLKAKQEHDEHQESKEKRERREKEYFQAEFGEPCGPKSQLILEDELGKGVFSTVFRCRDMGVSGKEYAIKFIRANPMLRKATEKEVRLMRRLRNEASVKDPEGARCFLGLAGPEVFEHSGHLALVFHLQRCDLRSGLHKYGHGLGLPLALVRNYTRDIFLALRALGKVNIIHSDVKPDNLLMSLDKASVKLSDFGSAMDVGERIRTDYLQPRYYRAPEVILGQSYSTLIDTWSAGATVFELASGRFLFTGRSNNDLLHEVLKTCGTVSKGFATSGEFAKKHFTPGGQFKWKTPSGEQILQASSFKRPSQPISKLLVDVAGRVPSGVDASAHQAMVKLFGDLVGKAAVPDPAERGTPDTILAHRFLQKNGTT